MALTAETYRLLRDQQRHINLIVLRLDEASRVVWRAIRADIKNLPADDPQRSELIRAYRTKWGEAFAQLARETQVSALELQRLAFADQVALATSQLPVGVAFHMPNAEAERWLAQRVTERISTTANRLSAAVRTVLLDGLEQGIREGLNPVDVSDRFISKARRMGVEVDRLAARSVNIARTEMLDAYRNASQMTYLANADVVTGWMWVTNISPATCPSCIAMHGTEHSLDEFGPADHPQGRCTRVPTVKRWSDLGIDIPEPPPVQMSGEAAFGLLSEKQQRQILGPAGFEAWSSGRWPMSKWSSVVKPEGWRAFRRTTRPPVD